MAASASIGQHRLIKSNNAFVVAGGQLAAWLRVRYPDIIAGAISSSSALLGAPGLGLVSPTCTPLCLHSGAPHAVKKLQAQPLLAMSPTNSQSNHTVIVVLRNTPVVCPCVRKGT